MWGMEQMPAAHRPKNKKTCYYWGLLRFARLGASALRAEASARGAMTTPCPAHHLEPAFLSIKNVELFFYPLLTKVRRICGGLKHRLRLGVGFRRVLTKVQRVYVFFKRFLR